MTEKNADVEWLRGALSMMAPRPDQRVSLSRKQAESILAHIDELGAEVNAWKTECVGDRLKAMADRRPTVHEIAAQIYAQMMCGTELAPWAVRFAEFAYDAAVALVAEGRRRDGHQ